MAVSTRLRPDQTVPSRQGGKVWWVVGGLVAAAVLGTAVVVWQGSEQPAVTPAAPAVVLHPELVRHQQMTDTALLQELAGRGLIPGQAVPETMTDTELLQDLARRGLIPEQAVPREQIEQEMLQDLADRGLIPQQAVPAG
jgi:hypothetical protein